MFSLQIDTKGASKMNNKGYLVGLRNILVKCKYQCLIASDDEVKLSFARLSAEIDHLITDILNEQEQVK